MAGDEYDITDRGGGGHDELIILATTITGWQAAPAQDLAAAYHQRWEHETGNAQLKTYLRGPGKALRAQSPAMAEQEIWGYLLTHYAISALICTAATSAGIDPDRVKFKRTLRIIAPGGRPGFSPLTSPCWHESPLSSPPRTTSSPRDGTAPAPAPSKADATTPTAQETRLQ